MPKTSHTKKTLEVIGDKWTPLVLQELSKNPTTFSCLEASLPGISPRTLSQRLGMLEDQKIIKKKCYCDHPPRFEYCLTDKGKDLEKILVGMAKWGQKYSS